MLKRKSGMVMYSCNPRIWGVVIGKKIQGSGPNSGYVRLYFKTKQKQMEKQQQKASNMAQQAKVLAM